MREFIKFIFYPGPLLIPTIRVLDYAIYMRAFLQGPVFQPVLEIVETGLGRSANEEQSENSSLARRTPAGILVEEKKKTSFRFRSDVIQVLSAICKIRF